MPWHRLQIDPAPTHHSNFCQRQHALLIRPGVPCEGDPTLRALPDWVPRTWLAGFPCRLVSRDGGLPAQDRQTEPRAGDRRERAVLVRAPLRGDAKRGESMSGQCGRRPCAPNVVFETSSSRNREEAMQPCGLLRCLLRKQPVALLRNPRTVPYFDVPTGLFPFFRKPIGRAGPLLPLPDHNRRACFRQSCFDTTRFFRPEATAHAQTVASTALHAAYFSAGLSARGAFCRCC